MEVVHTSETSVYLTRWQYIPGDSKLHTRRRENLKSHRLRVFENRALGRIYVEG